jgi:hypothetical protein
MTTTAADTGSTLEYARSYRDAGLATVPIRLDGSKRPAISEWEQRGIATDDDLSRWFACSEPFGIGIVCGPVSGGVERIDIDQSELYGPWCELVEEMAPGLLVGLNVVQTPRPGYQVGYRCTEIPIPGNQKLAEALVAGKRITLIETRGTGGQFLAPGCPPACHPTGKLYQHIAGPDLTKLRTISANEREILIAASRSFHRIPSTNKPNNGASKNGELKPGEDYDRRGPDWADILTGWDCLHKRGTVRYWRRPGKEGKTWSATTGYCKAEDDVELLHVFSSNAHPFEPNKSYGKFRAFGLLHHNGDFTAAARALEQQGYGSQRASTSQPSATSGAKSASRPRGFQIGCLTLRPGAAHRTPSKVCVPLAILRGGQAVDHTTLNSSASGRTAVVKLVACHLEGDAPTLREKIAPLLGEILAVAVADLDRQAGSDQLLLCNMIRSEVPAVWRLLHRTVRGAWSEARNMDVARHEFISFTPGWLLEAAAVAVDAPRTATGHVNRPALLQAVKGELEILWADVVAQLPTAANAELLPEMAFAARLRAALIRCWHVPCVHERQILDNGKEVVVGGSLISRVQDHWRKIARHDRQDGNYKPRWKRIHKPYMAWWRLGVDPDGELVPVLAIHHALANQVRLELPGIANQDELTRIGRRAGLIELNTEADGIPARTSQHRFAVLSADLSRELFDDLEDYGGENQDQDRGARDCGTQG